mgnify:FL=1
MNYENNFQRIHKHTLKAKRKYEGEVFQTNGYGEVVVLEFLSAEEITVSFVNTENEVVTTLTALLSGCIKDNTQPSVIGVGVLGVGEYSPSIHKKHHTLWCSMLSRCYNKTNEKYKNYRDCKVSANFLDFQFFAKWCEDQIGFNKDGFEIDKDLLSKQVKIYSEKTCVFLPKELNSFLALPKTRKGKLGVSKISNNKYRVRGTFGGGLKCLGTYETEQEAFQAYKEAKEAYIKELANKWKDQIDPRAYEALMNWSV